VFLLGRECANLLFGHLSFLVLELCLKIKFLIDDVYIFWEKMRVPLMMFSFFIIISEWSGLGRVTRMGKC
jgi:hypothetical protein